MRTTSLFTSDRLNRIHNTPLEWLIREQQRHEAERILNKYIRKYISGCDGSCSLTEVRDMLISKGVKAERLVHSINDISEQLEMKSGETVLNIYHPLFPKDKSKRIRFTVNGTTINTSIKEQSAPEGVADLLLAVEGWMPEYYRIEEEMLAEEKQRTLVCDIAIDLLKKNIGETLEKKGYKYEIFRIRKTGSACMRIEVSRVIKMEFEIDLMEDFLEQITLITKSLPVNGFNDTEEK